jgi:hypothetical protein
MARRQDGGGNGGQWQYLHGPSQGDSFAGHAEHYAGSFVLCDRVGAGLTYPQQTLRTIAAHPG